MQFWITTRHVLVLQRALPEKPGSAVVEHEQFLHTFLTIAATLKEAADAFCTADSLGVFDVLPLGLQPQLVIVRKECDESNNSSLQTQFPVRLRNTAGAHFGKTLIQKGLSSPAP